MASRAPLKRVPIHLQSAQSRLLIRGGRIINDDQSFYADIYLQDGVIKQIGTNLVVPGGAKIIDAKGKLVIPGGIDAGTHFFRSCRSSTPVDDFYNGTKAALAGGTTMIFDYVLPERGQSLLEAYNQWRDAADAKACCDYGLHVCITWWSDRVAEEVEILAKDRGVNSFHVFMAYKDHYMLKDVELYNVFKLCKRLGAVVTVHAQNGCLIKEKEKEVFERRIFGPEGRLFSHSEDAEAEAVYRAIMLASLANAPVYIRKVMSRMAADIISESRRAGKVVFGEVLPAAVAVDGSRYLSRSWRRAAAAVSSPPLSSDPTTAGYLTDLLANGDLQLTASDNCTFDVGQKTIGLEDFRKIPDGFNGVEDRMSVLWEKGVASGKMDACRFVAITSTLAARIFNLYPKKGRIAFGSDADLIVWDPVAKRTISSATHHQKCDFNIFEGLSCHGVAHCVISSGCVVLDANDGLRVTQSAGQFVAAACGSEYVYGRVWEREKLRRKLQKVRRAPYVGPALSDKEEKLESDEGATKEYKVEKFHSRPPTRSGGRNLQDSSFAFSGAQFDDTPVRTSSRVIHPPGGRSTSLW